MPQLYHFTHSSPEITTVADLLANANSPAYLYNREPERFLKVIGEDGLTNRERIEATYTLPDDPPKGTKFSRMTLKVGTVFYLEAEMVNKPSFLTDGIEVVSTDEPAFKAAKLAELEADKGYYQIDRPIHGQLQNGNYQQFYPDVTVWIWCAALSPMNEENEELKGTLLNISPFIQNLTTNSAKNGGNFTFTLPPLICEVDEENKWSLKRNISWYSTNNSVSLQGDGYLATSSLYHTETAQENPDKASDNILARNGMFFHNVIKQNDLILIRFETLELEKAQRYEDAQEFTIKKDNIADRIYDMIGLVDNNQQSVTSENNDVTITITGRDLSKLFIDDGTYFYALENSQGILKFAGQSTIKDSQISRIFSDNGMSFIGLYQFTSIEYILKFIIQQLANIKIVPNDLFVSYGDRRSKRFNEYTVTAKNKKTDKKYKQEFANGIWQLIDLVIDKSVANRRLADASMSTANGSLLNFIHSACQEPLVEFFMDTYSDRFCLIARKPPYDQKALISLIEGKVNTENGQVKTPPAIVDVHPEDVLQENLSYDTTAYSWYHFFPKNALIGDAENYSLSYLPALFFEEYAQAFGSRPFQQCNTYLPYVALENKNNIGGLTIVEMQAVEDLKYVVEANQYLPFTRRGTLTLNRDRRLKIGNIFRYKATGEIFFIEGVQHSFSIIQDSINATTTVNVSRGMIEQFIYGKYMASESGKPKFVSYFNIIDTRLNIQTKLYDKEITKRVKKNDVAPVQSITKNVVTPASFIVDNFLQNASVIDRGENKGLGYLATYEKYPAFKDRFTAFVNAINKAGYWVIITDGGNRSYAKQAALRMSNKKNALPGTSKHGKGAAIDLNLINKQTGEYYQMKTSKEKWVATGIPGIAKSLGLKWGGDFVGYHDNVHFEIESILETDMLTDAQLEAEQWEYISEMLKEPQIDREGIFKNFNVNKFAFNFFRKNLQFAQEHRTVSSRNIYENGGVLLDDVIVKTKNN